MKMTNTGNLIIHEYTLQTLVHRLRAGDGDCDGEDDVMTTIDELKRILALPDSASKKNIIREAIAEIEALRDDNAELRNQVTQLSTELSDLKLKKTQVYKP